MEKVLLLSGYGVLYLNTHAHPTQHTITNTQRLTILEHPTQHNTQRLTWSSLQQQESSTEMRGEHQERRLHIGHSIKYFFVQ